MSILCETDHQWYICKRKLKIYKKWNIQGYIIIMGLIQHGGSGSKLGKKKNSVVATIV